MQAGVRVSLPSEKIRISSRQIKEKNGPANPGGFQEDGRWRREGEESAMDVHTLLQIYA